jgi:hypothetical protein
MKLENVDPKTNSENWNKFIIDNARLNIENCFIAHNPCIAEIFEEVFGYKSEYYCITENDKVVALMPGFRIEKKFGSIPIFPTTGIFTHNLSKLEDWCSEVVEFLADYEVRSNLRFGKYVYDKKNNCIIYFRKDIDSQFSNFSTKLKIVIR